MRTLLLWAMVATAVMTTRQVNADEYISPSLFISSSGQFASVSNGAQVQISGPFDPTGVLDPIITATLNVDTNSIPCNSTLTLAFWLAGLQVVLA